MLAKRSVSLDFNFLLVEVRDRERVKPQISRSWKIMQLLYSLIISLTFNFIKRFMTNFITIHYLQILPLSIAI